MPHFFFFVGLALMLTHELDAVRCREWSIFPFLSRLDDRVGANVWTLAHAPLYLLLFWALGSGSFPNPQVVLGLDIFFLVHVALHLLFLKHPQNQFRSALAWMLILGAGFGGLLDLVGF